MEYCISDILELVKQKTGAQEASADSDIESDLGCTGDDFVELMDDYSKKFNVEMSTYLWYFHHPEEGSSSIGGMFFKSPDSRVSRIPVTPKILLEFAQKGKWDLVYPEHSIPKKRYDLLINAIVIFLVTAFLLYRCLK